MTIQDQYDFENLLPSIIRDTIQKTMSQLPDLRIICRNNETLHTHISVISLISPGLRRILSSTHRSDYETLVVPDIDKSTIESMIDLYKISWKTESRMIDVDCLELIGFNKIMSREANTELHDTQPFITTNLGEVKMQDDPEPATTPSGSAPGQSLTVVIDGDYDEIDEELQEPASMQQDTIADEDAEDDTTPSNLEEELQTDQREEPKSSPNLENIPSMFLFVKARNSSVDKETDDLIISKESTTTKQNDDDLVVIDDESDDSDIQESNDSEELKIVEENKSANENESIENVTEETDNSELQDKSKEFSKPDKQAVDDIDMLLEDEHDTDVATPAPVTPKKKVTDLFDVDDVVDSVTKIKDNFKSVACIIKSCDKIFRRRPSYSRAAMKQRIENHFFSDHPSEKAQNAFRFNKCSIDACGEKVYGKVNQKKHFMKFHDDQQETIISMLESIYTSQRRHSTRLAEKSGVSGVSNTINDVEGVKTKDFVDVEMMTTEKIEKIQRMVDFSSDSSSDDEET